VRDTSWIKGRNNPRTHHNLLVSSHPEDDGMKENISHAQNHQSWGTNKVNAQLKLESRGMANDKGIKKTKLRK